MNSEGLTWKEWYAAATLGDKVPTPTELKIMKKEWAQGVDPTEWASYFNKK